MRDALKPVGRSALPQFFSLPSLRSMSPGWKRISWLPSLVSGCPPSSWIRTLLTQKRKSVTVGEVDPLMMEDDGSVDDGARLVAADPSELKALLCRATLPPQPVASVKGMAMSAAC